MSFNISSGAWSELNGSILWVRHPVFIARPVMLSCIKWRTVCYKSSSPYGNLETYLGYVFIERLIGWMQ